MVPRNGTRFPLGLDLCYTCRSYTSNLSQRQTRKGQDDLSVDMSDHCMYLKLICPKCELFSTDRPFGYRQGWRAHRGSVLFRPRQARKELPVDDLFVDRSDHDLYLEVICPKCDIF